MFARKGLPFIDAANSNGSATEFGATLRKAVGGIPDVDTVIPGHADDPHVWQDLVDYAGFYNDLLMQTQQGKAAGRSAAEIVSSYSVPDRYRDFAAPTNSLERIVPLVLEGPPLALPGVRGAAPSGNAAQPRMDLTPFARMGDHGRTDERVTFDTVSSRPGSRAARGVFGCCV